MRPLEHHHERRALRNDEATVLKSVAIHGIRGPHLVMMQLLGPNGPWDFVVALYHADGTRAGTGSWQGPSRERAEEMFDGFLESERRRSA